MSGYQDHKICPRCGRNDLDPLATCGCPPVAHKRPPGVTVASISDDDLLRRVVTGCKPGRFTPRWVAVMDTFMLSSTFAKQLCNRFGFDPDELKAKR